MKRNPAAIIISGARTVARFSDACHSSGPFGGQPLASNTQQ
jgi:hypothetical protein